MLWLTRKWYMPLRFLNFFINLRCPFLEKRRKINAGYRGSLSSFRAVEIPNTPNLLKMDWKKMEYVWSVGAYDK